MKKNTYQDFLNAGYTPKRAAKFAADDSKNWKARNGGSRSKPKSIGREAYEEDLQKTPNYHDGKPRPSWENLRPIARHSWSRPLRDDS